MVKLIRMECNWRIKSHHTASKNQQPEHTRAPPQTLTRTTGPPSLLLSHSGSVVIWKLQYSSQQFLSASHVLLALFPLSDKSCTSCSLSLSPCQVRLAWLWTPCLHILLNTLLVDAGFLHNAWRWVHALEMWALDGGWRRMERKYKKMRGPACVSLCFGGLYRSRCYLAFQH